MSRPNPFVLTAGFLLFIAAFGGLSVLKEGLFLDTHEGDTYHLLDILLRIEAGMRPHLDFSLPLGFLAFLPISSFIDAGFPVGSAIIFAQLSLASVLLPFVIYVCVTRFSRPLAWLFGVLVLGLVLSLNFGAASDGVSISVHYNRWAWAISFVALALAILPAPHERPVLDGLLIGVLGATLALLKVTFFVALGPAVLVAVILRWRGKGVLAVALGGLGVAVVATVLQGFAFWPAYLGDLILVSGSEVRPFAGLTLNDSIAAPKMIGATLVGIAAIFMIRRSGQEVAGYAMLLLVPGFIYVTYQNFGNDPQWIWFLALVIFALRPEVGVGQIAGHDLRLLMSGAAWMALAVSFPSLFANATSTITHASMDETRFMPMLPDDRGHQDIFIRRDRAQTMTAQVHRDRVDPNWSRYSEEVDRSALSELNGISFPHCEWMAGSRAYLERIAEELRADGVTSDDQVLPADILAGLWMFGPFKPLDGGAPWYYGGLTGLENADYLMVPKCVFVAKIRRIMLKELNEADTDLTLVSDNDLYALFTVTP
ncbi:hypothetical protein N9L47_09370 [Rhodobacteraceae bacterium]|nr:hypothetical protein [Paracoccaceae bacterium]